MKRISLSVTIVIVVYILTQAPISSAERVKSEGSVIESIPGEGPPPITRDPFINAPPVHKERPANHNRSKSDINKKNSDSSLDRSKDIADIIRDHKVTGVLLGWDRPAALLNQRIVGINDRIDEFTVTYIDRNGILLSDGERVIHLPLE